MDINKIKKGLEELDKTASKRKFNQSIELIINLKNINIKQNPIDLFVILHHNTGKKIRIGAFVGQELAGSAAETCDVVVKESELGDYSGKKAAVGLSKKADFFIAQANLMAKVATALGKVLGPKGKMPNPKAGGIVPPNADLKAVVDRLKRTVRLSAKKDTSIKCMVGKEGMDGALIADNISYVYDTLIKNLPLEENNIKNVMVKKTMSKAVKV